MIDYHFYVCINPYCLTCCMPVKICMNSFVAAIADYCPLMCAAKNQELQSFEVESFACRYETSVNKFIAET
jgi:hypothetical protein